MMRIDTPQPGTYRTRIARGVWGPAVIRYESSRDEEGRLADRGKHLVLYRNGEVIHNQAEIDRLWPYLHPVTEQQIEALAGQQTDKATVPDFGQPDGHNSRDAELTAAARAALDAKPDDTSEAMAANVALLVKQIISEEHRLDVLLREALAPLKAEMAALRAEHTCDCAEHKPELLYWLKAWAEAHGGNLPTSATVSPHWRKEHDLVCLDPKKTPREFLEPDKRRILSRLLSGAKVPGWKLTETRVARVV